MQRKVELDRANCGKYLHDHQPHWFWIRDVKIWCPGKAWKGGGD